MSAAARIRARNTAFVQIGIAIGFVAVCAILILIALAIPTTMKPGGMTGFAATLMVFVALAAWMFRRGRQGLRRTTDSTT